MNIIKFLWDNKTSVLLIGAIILAILWFNQCNRTGHLKDEMEFEKQRNIQNVAALTDSLENYINDNGDTSYQKPIAEMTVDELKENFPDLYAAIEAETGEVKYIIKEKIVYRDTGSVINVLTELENDKYSLNFNYASDDSLLIVKGRSEFTAFPYHSDDDKLGIKLFPGRTFFDETKISIGLTTGVRKDEDGISRIFVTPDSDKISITGLQ